MDVKAMEITIDDMRNGTTMVVTIISVVPVCISRF